MSSNLITIITSGIKLTHKQPCCLTVNKHKPWPMLLAWKLHAPAEEKNNSIYL